MKEKEDALVIQRDEQQPQPTALTTGALTTGATEQTIVGLLDHAIERGIDVAGLERLVALHERVADRQAVQEFADALASFQAECPSVQKTSTANIATKGGARYSYTYAPLDVIAATVRPFLHQRGLSYTWDSVLEQGRLTCICTLRHVNGHSINASFVAPVESSAGMSEQQKHAAALTYARRQSLVSVLGLTSTEPDTDAASTDTITGEQVKELEDMIVRARADRARYLKYLGVACLEDLCASEYASAFTALQAKIRKGRAPADAEPFYEQARVVVEEPS